MQISGRLYVKNEEATVWYAVASVIDYLDELVVWIDPTSTDSTKDILTNLHDKIRFVDIPRPEKDGKLDKPTLITQLYKQQRGDVSFILDGDEVYFEWQIEKIINDIKATYHKADAWNWYSRYFVSKDHYLDDRCMTRALKLTPDLHEVPYVPPDYPEHENISWIRHVPANSRGPITSDSFRVKIIDVHHFHFPYRSSPIYKLNEGRYDGPYPRVFPDNFDYSLLFPKQ